MTKAELKSLGGSDAMLVAELRKYTGATVRLARGDSPKARGVRREAWEMVTWLWFQPEGTDLSVHYYKRPRGTKGPSKVKRVGSKNGVALEFDVHTTMPWLLPQGWPAHGELDGKPVRLVEAMRNLGSDECSNIVVDIPGTGRMRPFRGQDIAFGSDGVLYI
jgi:hypothetical protein